MSYASDTSVSVEKTRAEIESLLMRKGADKFMVMVDKEKAGIAFQLHKKQLRFILPLPDRADKRFWQTPRQRRTRSPEEAYREWEQACRSRWRGLYLNIKAKLEAVEIGITDFETEFLPHFILPSGRTVAETVLPELERHCANMKPGQLLLG